VHASIWYSAAICERRRWAWWAQNHFTFAFWNCSFIKLDAAEAGGPARGTPSAPSPMATPSAVSPAPPPTSSVTACRSRGRTCNAISGLMSSWLAHGMSIDGLAPSIAVHPRRLHVTLGIMALDAPPGHGHGLGREDLTRAPAPLVGLASRQARRCATTSTPRSKPTRTAKASQRACHGGGTSRHYDAHSTQHRLASRSPHSRSPLRDPKRATRRPTTTATRATLEARMPRYSGTLCMPAQRRRMALAVLWPACAARTPVPMSRSRNARP
jgi:hypothetical protein